MISRFIDFLRLIGAAPSNQEPREILSSSGVFPPQDSGAGPPPSETRWIRLILLCPPLHLIEFLGRDLGHVPDEQNQTPGLRDSVRSAEGWHAAQTNSILNCVVELTIALVLRRG